MKILYIGNQLSKYGKTATNIETLGPQLESIGFELVYASNKHNPVFRLLHMLYTLIKVQKKVDYILIDTYSTFAFYYAFFIGKLAQLFNKKYIPILHGGNLPNRLLRNPLLCKQLFGKAYALVSPSAYLVDAFKQFGFKSQLIPNNINIEQYRFKKREKISPRLLWVRSFHKIYNPVLAIFVLEELVKKYSNAELCMIGPNKDGTMDKVKSLIIEKGLETKIKITGRLTKQEWVSYSKEYDVFINTTNFDNTPVSVIEAMALGLPVVSTNVGGLPYLLENEKDSLLIPPNKKDAMVIAIDKLISQPEFALALSLAARKKALTFAWENIKYKWMDLLS